ncbi:MAG TPA: CusA/CzcA family heavy metal efflux RND transporter [Oculatellaceae cyanobacterium]
MTIDHTGPIESLVTWTLNKRVLVLTFILMFAGFGLWSFLTMHVDAVPDISNIQVTVTTNAKGFAPTEVEQYITYPIELALQSVPRLHQQRSISKYALSQITAVFDDGTDIYWARQQVSERLKGAQEQMPPGADVKIALGPIATGLGEIFQFEVKGPGFSLIQLRDILDWQVIPALKTVPGIDEVQSMGGEAKEYQVCLIPERLHGYKITPVDVMTALSKSNANAGGGYIVESSDQELIRAESMLRNVSDIENVVVRRDPLGVLRIKDIARVKIGYRLPQSIVTSNGRGQAVIGVVIMRKGENSREVVELVREKLRQVQKTLTPNIELKPFYDRGKLIDRTVETVKENLLHGAVLVLLVLLVLLGSIRGGLIAALAIPLALAGSLLFLKLGSISGNLLSLGAIDFGILIDGSVVMVENVLRRLSHPHKGDRITVITEAACEVAVPVLTAVLIITIVYLPILGLPGVSGKTFQPMALTVIFGLLTALVIALFVTPTMCYYMLEEHPKETENFVLAAVRRFYRKSLFKASRHPFITASFAVTAFLFSLLLIPVLGSEFIPVLKEGSVVLTVSRPVSGSLETAAAQTSLIEKIILELPSVSEVISRTGHSEIAFDPMGPEETDVFIILKPPSKWAPGVTQQTIEDAISKRLKDNLPGIVFSVSQPIEQRMNELVAGAKSDVAIRVFGDDLDKLRSIGQDIARVVEKIDGAADLKLEQTAGLPVISAQLNQAALGSYGVFAQDALSTVSAAVDGRTVGTIYEGKPRYPLTVKFDPATMASAEDLGNLPVSTASGELVPLRQVAKIKKSLGAAQITHLQGDRLYMVQFNVRGRDLGSFVAAAQLAVDKQVNLPPGYRIEWGGQFENMKQAQERLCLLVPVSLMLIFTMLFGLYGDWKPGVLIFANIPLAFSGGLIALYARHMPISVTAGVGFIALFGVAVLNGVVLVSTIRQLERNGMHPRQAAMAGAALRLRPVLMTALVASLGFVPMALATSAGAEVQRPLATVVIAGLVSSTALTLLVLPSLYAVVCSKKRTKRKARARKPLAGAVGVIMLALILSDSANAAELRGLDPAAQADALSSPSFDSTLTQILNEGLQNSPRMDALRRQLEVTKSNLIKAGQLPNPSIFMDNGYRAEFTYRYGASMPVEMPWKLALRILAAKKSITVSDLEIARNLWNFRADVRRYYTEAVIANERLAMYFQINELAAKLKNAAARRFQAGDAAYTDVLKAELAFDQAGIAKEQGALEITKANQLLRIIMGRPRQSAVDELTRRSSRGISLPAESLDALVVKAFQNRLDLKLNDQLLAQAKLNLKLAIANAAPNPIIGSGFSTVNGPPTTINSVGTKNDFHGFFFQAAVELPVLNRQQGDIARFKAEIEQLKKQRVAQENTIEAEVTKAYQSFLVQKSKIDRYEKTTLATSAKVVQMSQKAYEMGQSDIAAVLLAQQSNLQVRTDYLESIRNLQLSFTDLEQAVGLAL